ncbi:tRNA/rRNA methyltransferase (SpoU) [Syntrophobotulus glycolicus DSM 8271]|uniref:Putative tRNA (cytidine(34)-2'-O)-methyltransferase n=1 Tax=Syntrophobotulus glycolicus (strain DSM 8271 / FlGlyR) TaxID=645991 RepID=F0SYZ9_SYNGF|nr:tRNA (cytidine(34)-2'-O)-methyltransferase [Syntrophobotulus glycolicus]ADY56036.1 tRNA/rRNA methyltransferase (SpoU) [Syntrophobotulus glycolicus DSM 8271]
MTGRLNIVLVEPEIPPNTGNIARLCAVVGADLHLVKPLGFKTDDKSLKRAGLDYWHRLKMTIYEDFDDFEARNPGGKRYLATTKGKIIYSETTFEEGCYLIFGRETKGLSPEILARYPEHLIRLPMKNECRSLNLSNAVAIVTYEVFRQWGYPGLS